MNTVIYHRCARCKRSINAHFIFCAHCTMELNSEPAWRAS